jgi:hypothetical protein
MKQTTFASFSYQSEKEQAQPEKCLAKMDQVVPWEPLVAVFEPYYPADVDVSRYLWRACCGST